MDHLTAEKIETIQTETEKREQSVRFWKCSKYVAKTWFESRTANITLFADFYRDTIFSCLNYKGATFDEIFSFVLLAVGICTKKLLFLKFKNFSFSNSKSAVPRLRLPCLKTFCVAARCRKGDEAKACPLIGQTSKANICHRWPMTIQRGKQTNRNTGKHTNGHV